MSNSMCLGGSFMSEILVVDDDKVTRKTLGAVLRAAGHRVTFASDGIKGLSVLEDNPHIELVVTDVIMPGLDGRELVAALRRHEKFSQLPTLIMSATVNVREIRSLLEAGAERFLAKPIAKDRLLDEVEALLDALKPSSSTISIVPEA